MGLVLTLSLAGMGGGGRSSGHFFFLLPPEPRFMADSLTVVEGLRFTVLCLTNRPVLADRPRFVIGSSP